MNGPEYNQDQHVYPWLREHWLFFQKRLRSDRLAHAILIKGPEGVGKLSLANAMAHSLLCRRDFEYACGECRSCQLLPGGAHPEYFQVQLLEKKKEILVEQVRELTGKLDLTTSISARKVACIYPAELMTRGAVNALLKSLEEPAGDTVLILVSDNPGSLPATIRSRCQSINVSLPEKAQALEWLSKTAGQSPQQVQPALEAAGGSPLLALRYLDSHLGEAFVQVRRDLSELLGRPASVSGYTASLGEWEPAELWRWLSMHTADMIKSGMKNHTLEGLPANIHLKEKNLLQLQLEADRNRQLTKTTVRQDLMLQEWLIKWAELALK